MLRYFVGAIILLCVIYFISKRFRNKRKNEQMAYEQQRRDKMRPEDNFNTIFVAIPCYRDEHACAETLFSLFNEASCPWRLQVAILHHVSPSEQNYAMDISNLYEHVVMRHNATSFQGQIKIIVETTQNASGPWNARNALIKKLFQNERFYMAVHCRTHFTRNWDQKCMDQYTRCLKLSPRPILTTYPALYDPQGLLESLATYPVLSADGELQAIPYARVPVRPFPSVVVSPSFLFCSSRFITECPHSVEMPLVSDKEGLMLMSARYYTYGWDFYTPTEPIMYKIARSTKQSRISIDRPDTRAAHEQQLIKINGLLNTNQCRICEDDRAVHDEFIGHSFESWMREDRLFGHVRTVDSYLKFAQKAYLGISGETTPEEQVSKFDKIIY